jgi:hypothetical protein
MQTIVRGNKTDLELLQTLDIHQMLFAQCLRTGHGVIDLYLSRLRQGTSNLTPKTRAAWMQDLADTLKHQSESTRFSTYSKLNNLAKHLHLIIKTNLPDVYDKSSDEYRKYLSQMLNPVAPIIGAHGETVGSRSAQVRKFRMPGYPLALISTDVFQEGEDLHTFCDSVTHYGLPNSPVSIEQKTGRVDRVASMAQRRLLQISHESDLTDEALIQVTFPFVKESIEVLQVRRLCNNINEFIASIHDIGAPLIDAQDVIDTYTELQDRSPIPEQISTLLHSPYEPKLTRKVPKNNREQFVIEQGTHVLRIERHLEHLLTTHFGSKVLNREGLTILSSDGLKKHVTLRLKSARASGEILLSASVKHEEIDIAGLSRKQFLELMQKLSWNTYHRTYALETANRRYQLYYDAEILVGDETQTTPNEIARFLERFTIDHDPNQYRKPIATDINRYWKRAAREARAQYGQRHAEILRFEQRDCLGLTFHFTETTWQRKHRIKIYEAGGRCIFMAKAVSASRIKDFSIEQLVKLTWQRNAHIDIVEFTLDDEGNLIGRAIHPSDGLTYKEFVYCAYTLAVATDRLEYLVQEADLH